MHWFKWEAYTTWISGFVLLIIVYYLNAEGLMIDKNVNDITPFTAIIISIIFLISSWFLYDLLCKSKLLNQTALFTTICFIISVIVCYFLTKIYGSRAAYIHVGASLGTIMALNVFRVIIPSQKNMVNAALSNQKPDMSMANSAKTRSIHNNYMTLPVLFIMISAHYPFTYGHKYNWLILALISVIGALVRHYFNLRNKKQYKPWILPVAAIGMVLLIFYTALPKIISNQDNAVLSTEKISFIEINNIIKYRCSVCHAKNPTAEGIDSPPKGIVFDSAEDILNNLSIIQSQAIDSDVMPPGNMTGITQQERDKLLLWIQQGADINK